MSQHYLVTRPMKAIAACGAIFDQADAGNVQLADSMHAVAAGRLGVEAQNCSHPRQKRGIDTIGLGALADGLGKLSARFGFTLTRP